MNLSALTIIAALLVPAAPALAQPFTIPWYTIDSGGGTSNGGIYTIRGTIGQHDAATESTGGLYTIRPGFWPGVSIAQTCNGDLNGDGILDLGDIQTFITLFLLQDLAVDFNGDSIIDQGDIQSFVAVFLAGC